MLIYVAGPLTTNADGESVSPNKRTRNKNAAIQASISILKKGHYPFIPHTHTDIVDELMKVDDFDMGEPEFLDWDFVILDRCDAMLFLGHSYGADAELERSLKAGRKIYYNVDEIEDINND